MRRIELTPPRRVVRVRFDPHGTLWTVLRTYPFMTRWDSSGDGPSTLDWRLPASTRDVAFAPHNLGLAFGISGGRVEYRSSVNGTPPSMFEIGSVGLSARLALQFAPVTDERRCWLAMAASQFCLWNPYSQEYIYAETTYYRSTGDYRGVAFGPNGSFVTSIEYHAHRLTAWKVKPFGEVYRTELTGLGDFTNGSVAVLPDGERIVYAAGDQLRCVSMTGGPGWETALKKPVIDLALHPSGKSVLIADGSKRVTQVDTTNGRVAQQFDWGVGKVSCVDVSADGTLAAAGGEKGQVVVWDGE